MATMNNYIRMQKLHTTYTDFQLPFVVPTTIVGILVSVLAIVIVGVCYRKRCAHPKSTQVQPITPMDTRSSPPGRRFDTLRRHMEPSSVSPVQTPTGTRKRKAMVFQR
jgi:hypothetical protein